MEEKFCEPCDEADIDKRPPCPLECKCGKCATLKKDVDLPVNLVEHLFLWVYGAPCCGKSTQVQKIVGKYGLVRVNVGDLLKQEIATKPMMTKSLENCLLRGELAPNDLVLKLLKKEVEWKVKKGAKGFVIDGFPREERQGIMFEKMIAPVHLFVFLDAKRDTLMKRREALAAKSMKRWPTDRRKDNCITGEYQISVFYDRHRHIIEQYPHKLVKINTEGKSQEQVFSEVELEVNKVLEKQNKEIKARKDTEAEDKPMAEKMKEKYGIKKII